MKIETGGQPELAEIHVQAETPEDRRLLIAWLLHVSDQPESADAQQLYALKRAIGV